MDLQKLLHTVFLKSPENYFDEFIKECQMWYSKPAHTFTEMRTRDNKKIRGDIFEDFCVLYLKHIKGYETVWLLEDVPDDILQKLSLKRRDMGIDIIVSAADGYYAVQCKYKTPTIRKTFISWTALSTFYAMCLRTGPWAKYIIMTNCYSTRHQGPKTEKDLSICIGTFRGITAENWIKMCNITGTALEENVLIQSNEKREPSKQELRELRLAYYSLKP
jgi:predicted helicase